MMGNAIETARSSDNPAVSAWAGYTSLELASGDDRASIARELASDPDWRHRLIVGAALPELPIDLQREIAVGLSTDPEPSVRNLGAAWVEFNALGGVMAPRTPATAPSAPPATLPASP
jgi:hypothetical protein